MSVCVGHVCVCVPGCTCFLPRCSAYMLCGCAGVCWSIRAHSCDLAHIREHAGMQVSACRVHLPRRMIWGFPFFSACRLDLDF